jgi:hypothetical protein
MEQPAPLLDVEPAALSKVGRLRALELASPARGLAADQILAGQRGRN